MLFCVLNLLTSEKNFKWWNCIILFLLVPSVLVSVFLFLPSFGMLEYFFKGLILINVVIYFLALEKEMATHSSVLAWRIPGTGEPGGLPSMGSHRVRHNWTTSLSLFTFMHWRRKRQPTPVYLLGQSHGQGSLEGYSLRSLKESDIT